MSPSSYSNQWPAWLVGGSVALVGALVGLALSGRKQAKKAKHPSCRCENSSSSASSPCNQSIHVPPISSEVIARRPLCTLDYGPPSTLEPSLVTSVNETTSDFIVLGSGSSMGVPRIICLLDEASKCDTCRISVVGTPEHNPYHRGNPCGLIRFRARDESTPSKITTYNILIDACKTFRESAMRYFPMYKVTHLDAVVLTHEHADACHGLDDLRTLQPVGLYDVPAVPVYLSEFSKQSILRRFPYLDGEHRMKQEVKRKVSALDWHILRDFESVSIYGLRVVPLPLNHGADYISYGFLIGQHQQLIAYLSDLSAIPSETLKYLEAIGRPVDLLVLDSLFKTRKHNTHISLPEALDIVRVLKPKRTILVGMTDEFDHVRDNAELAEMAVKEGLYVQLSRDGLVVPIDL